jgi:hypothetical protein
MAAVNNPTEPAATNGAAGVQRLEALVSNLQLQCDKLREALAKAESEREAYRHLFLEEARQRREFEDADLAALLATSPGPVEKI